MSSHAQTAPDADRIGVTGANGAKHPVCKLCRQPIIVKLIAPVLFAGAFDDVVYGCERCGAEAKRTLKRK
jgi:RNase P subunit RPR2